MKNLKKGTFGFYVRNKQDLKNLINKGVDKTLFAYTF